MTTFITLGPASGSGSCCAGGDCGSYAGSGWYDCCGAGGKLSSAGGGVRTGCGIHVCAATLLAEASAAWCKAWELNARQCWRQALEAI